MTVRTIDDIYRDFVIDGVPASGPFNPYKPDIRDTLKALTEGSQNFPDNRVIRLNNANIGTPNNIIVTASVAIPAAAYQVLYILNVTQSNTGPVTVTGAINRDLVTNTSAPVPAGYLTPGMAVLCVDNGSELRMLSYGDMETIIAAAEAVLAATEEARDAAEHARDQAVAAASDAVSQGNVPIYSTRNAVEGLEIPTGIDAIRTNGFANVGDGGDALYKRVTSEPSHPGKLQSGDGAWWELVGNIIDIRVFGAKADGTTNDASAINNAQAYLVAKGGGVILYPSGTTAVGYATDSGSQRVAVLMQSGVYHRGKGRGVSIIKLLDDARCHMFQARARTDYGISGLTIDGNRSAQGVPSSGNDPAGLLLNDSSTRGIFQDLHIKNTYDYGIGVELGRATDNTFENILIEDVGADGIDFKNTTDNSTGNKINNITVRRFGLLGETGETFAGVDIRGQVMASQIRVEEIGSGMVTTGRHGIRIVGTEAGGSGGLGGHQSILDGFFLEGSNGSDTASTSVVGLRVSGRMCAVSNGRIRLTGVGILRTQRECVVSNITIEQCRRGWLSINNGELTDADNDSVAGLIIRDCKEVGMLLQAGAEGNSFMGAVLRGNAKNLQIEAGANNNRFIGGQCSTPTGATNYTDAGTGTVIVNVMGITTRSSNLSDQFPITSAGLQTITLAHNLAETPFVSQCQVSVASVSSDAAVLGAPYVSAIDATNLTIKVPVITAAPAGHTARVVAECGIKR